MTCCVVLDKVLSFSGYTPPPLKVGSEGKSRNSLSKSMAAPCHRSIGKEDLRLRKEPWSPRAADSLHRWGNRGQEREESPEAQGP